MRESRCEFLFLSRKPARGDTFLNRRDKEPFGIGSPGIYRRSARGQAKTALLNDKEEGREGDSCGGGRGSAEMRAEA
jgi:hypothetical protein